MSTITTRAGKGSPLTNNELDSNFTNLNADKVEIGGDLSGTPTAPIVTKVQGQNFSTDVPNVGEKLVWNGTAWEPATDPSGEPIGHEDKSQSSISFDAGTRTFTIAPVSANFVVWCKGVKHTYTSAQTVVIPNTTGLHFIYFNASGVLSTQMSYFTWEEHAPTSYIYWNATTQQAVYFGDERHGITLDWQTHEYLHRTRGAAIASGFAASGYTTTGTGTTDADAQIDVGGGTFFDEDLQVDIVSTNSPVAGTWQQDLSGPARIPVLYLSGSAWVIDAPTNFPFKVVSGVPQYNLLSGSTWSTAPVTNNEYFVTWILATHNLTYPVISVIGQAQTNNISAAESMTFEGLTLPGFPSVEFRPLYKIIYQYKTSYANTIKVSTISVYDLRSISAAGVAAALVQDHGNLSGLGDDDHAQYLHVSSVRSPSAAVTNSFLPSQASQSGKYLTTDGSNPSWGTIPSGSLTFTGDVTGTGNTGSSTTLTLANSGVTAGTFTKVTVDAKGRVTTGASIASGDVTTALGFTPESSSNKGVASGYASLDGSGKVPAAQLPSYVDDVLEYANLAAFPGTGESGKIYVAINTNKVYRWSGSAYVEITSSPGSTDAVPEGSTNLYFTNARARAAVSASGSLSYSTATGIFSYTQPTNVSAFTNDSGYLTGITGAQVTTALGYTPPQPNGTGASGTWGISITGNAASATRLISLRTINGVGFDGTANITVADSTKLPLSGGTLTGELYAPNLTVGGQGRSSLNAIGGNIGSTAGSWNNSQLELKCTDAGTVALSFHRAGYTANTIEARDGNGLRIDGSIILHAGNYNDYAPSRTGTAASGTWGIRITGFANAGSPRLYSTDATYNYDAANPYYGYLTYNSSSSRWRFKVSPATPDAVEVAYSDSAGNAATVTGITSAQVTTALGYTPLALTGLAGQTSAATGSVAGGGGRWLRVATLGTNWFYGRVKIWDSSSSGPHQSKEFTVSGAFNDRSKVSFVLLAGGSYNYVGVSKVRYLSASTYDPQYLEVYIDGAGSDTTWTVAIFEPRNASAVGFSAGSVPSGYTSVEWDCNGAFAAGSASGGFRIGYDNSAFVNGNTVLHTGNYGTHALPLSGGTLTGSLTGTLGYFSASTQGTPILRLNQADSSSGYYLLQGLLNGSEVMRIERSGTIVTPTGRFQKNQTAGNYTTAALWTESYGSTATGIAFHISGNVGKFLEMRTDGVLYWNGDTVLHNGNFGTWALSLGGGTVTGATNFNSGITVNNTSADGRGINLYSGSPTSPTYGLFFAQTSNFGTYGAVSADWATYFTMNSTANRGWIFREHDSLGNVAAISNQGNMTLRSHFEQGNNIARPNVSWSAGSTSTGMVIFYLPGTTSNYGMVHMVFDIYEYNGNAVSTVIVGGHNWSTSWYNTGCNVIGQCGKEVRLGVKDGRFCVVFGTSGSSWDYGTIVLRKIHNGSFYDNIMNMVGDWSATQTTTESFTSVTGDLRALRTPASFNAGGAITQAGNQVLHAGNYTNYFYYNVWDEWLRDNGDNNQFKIYGNSRSVVFRTDGVTNPLGGGADHPFNWFYGGNDASQRIMLLGTSGNLWTNSYGWLHDQFLQKGGGATLSGTTTFGGTMLFPSGGGNGATFGANHYSMGKDVANGSWSHPHYSDLIIGYHTGIRIGAAYSGIRFYNNSPTTDANNDGNGDGGESLLMTIGGHAAGSGVIINNSLTAYGSASANDVYTTGGWFRNHTNNNGIYWSATGWHLYPYNSNDFYFRSGSSESSIRFTNSSASELGYLHCASDSAMGFLTSGRSWRFRVDNSGNARCYNNLYIDQNYGHGIVGLYASTRYQGVFAMGDSYKLPADGTSAGNLYGMAWSYPSAGGVAGNLDSHGMLVLINGGFGSCMSYSIKASGNVTAYSDERLKTNWREMPTNFVERLAGVKVGIYDRTDGEKITQVGVSAQSLQMLLPEAITTAEDDMKTLSVSYGNAAMASAVELAKELVALRREVEALKSRLH